MLHRFPTRAPSECLISSCSHSHKMKHLPTDGFKTDGIFMWKSEACFSEVNNETSRRCLVRETRYWCRTDEHWICTVFQTLKCMLDIPSRILYTTYIRLRATSHHEKASCMSSFDCRSRFTHGMWLATGFDETPLCHLPCGLDVRARVNTTFDVCTSTLTISSPAFEAQVPSVPLSLMPCS